MVALHGPPGSVRDFRWLAPALSPHFRTVRPTSYWGTPWTTRPGYTPSDRALFVADVLDALDLPPAIILGHSVGGIVAAAVARVAPERVRGLAFAGTPGCGRTVAFEDFAARARWFAGGPATIDVLARRAFAANGFRGPYSDAALLHTLHGAAAIDLEVHAAGLRRLEHPSTVIWTEDDLLVEAQISEELAACVPDGPRLCLRTVGTTHRSITPSRSQSCSYAGPRVCPRLVVNERARAFGGDPSLGLLRAPLPTAPVLRFRSARGFSWIASSLVASASSSWAKILA